MLGASFGKAVGVCWVTAVRGCSGMEWCGRQVELRYVQVCLCLVRLVRLGYGRQGQVGRGMARCVMVWQALSMFNKRKEKKWLHLSMLGDRGVYRHK